MSRTRFLMVAAVVVALAWPAPALALREFVAFGVDAGGAPHVKVADARTGASRASFFAYDSAFRGGVRVALGDVNGDGTDDLVTAPGPGGGAHVKVFDGVQLAAGAVVELAGFLADPSFTGGLFVAVGELDGSNGAAREVVVGFDQGGEPRVRVFRVAGGVGVPIAGPLADFLAYGGSFRGGVRVAAASVDGVGLDEVVTATGPGGGPHVKVWKSDGQLLHDFFAYDAGFTGGVYVAAGQLVGGLAAEVVTGAGAGGGPEVRVFAVSAGAHALTAAFACYDVDFTGGVRVGYVPELQEVVCTPGPGYVSLALFNAPPFASAGDDIAAFDTLGTLVFPGFRGGVFSAPN